MELRERIELIRWLLERTDALRATYSNRAALTLSADAIVLAAIVFIADKNAKAPPGPLQQSIMVCAILSLLCMTISLFLAMAATVTLRRNSRVATRFQGCERCFLNPNETFSMYQSFDAFLDGFREMDEDGFIRHAAAELWVSFRLQRMRYKYLRGSMIFTLGAFLSLTTALLIAILGV